ncbi:MAG: hypothetical protein NXY57DRAFT_1043831 [Lentinula lateritia]|nr:MAG: hypothetical protein NXY57DRAFT_1043831 [Lentinula lateritia]
MPPEYYAVSIAFGDPLSTTFVMLPPLHFSAHSIQSVTLVNHGSGVEDRVRISGPIGTASNSLNGPSSNATTHRRQNDLTQFTNMPENMVAKVITPLALEEPQVKTKPESISLAIRCQGTNIKYFIEAHTPFDLKRKVINKNATTSWYTYYTPGPLDSPPEFPPNSMVLEHNVIFLHINEMERAKLNGGQLSKLLKYCVHMWICNGDSSHWERIYFGEQRVVRDGYELAISLRYRKGISSEWVTPKAMKRILKASRLLSSTKEKHKALSWLTTETNKLINHLNLFTEDYRLTVTSLLQERTSVHSSSSARNIAQNAKAIRTLIIHSSRFQEELPEDLPLRRALIRKLRCCQDVLKAVDSSFKRSGIVVRPSTHSASMCDQVSEASALSHTSRKDQDRFQQQSSRDEDISAYLSSFQSLSSRCNGGHPTLDDLQSISTNIKRRSLAMVFNIIEQFREDEQRISMEIKGTNDKLQAHQESHQEQLDVPKDCTENMIERLDLKLNDFKEEFNKSTAHGHLQYGQGNTTEYIGNLWTIALRFLPIHGTEDVGKIQRSVTDELQRLGDRIVAECFAVKDLRIHSSFMTSIYNSTTQVRT